MAKLDPRWHTSIREIPEHQWQFLVGDQAIPFYRWRWLAALEDSSSISPLNGWQPWHLAVWRGQVPVAVAPLYLKSHSFGEFVFDQAFARLAMDLGLNYYPKLIGMSPLSPVEGYRFYVADDEDEEEMTTLMIKVIDNFALKNGILSTNFLYVDDQWCKLAEKVGCAAWLNQQSLWSAEGQSDFSDYLSKFNANQRRNIKRERKAVKEAGLIVSAISGSDIDVNLLRRMHSFYEQHCAKWGEWGSKYLSETFFDFLFDPQQLEQLVLFSAHRGIPKDPLAMSLCVTDGSMLWGRYWGTELDIPSLHFEVCYYSPISWALTNGIKRFDPGAGGSHKRRRGFLAKSHTSLHRWYNRRMDKVIRDWLPNANSMMIDQIETLNADMPFHPKN